MPPSEQLFRLGMIVAISLLATVSGLAAEHFCGVERRTLLVDPLMAISAILIWRPTARVYINGE